MIFAKSMAMVGMLALAGAAVAQEKVDEQRTLPRATTYPEKEGHR